MAIQPGKPKVARIIVELEDGQSLVLGRGELNRYLGMFWGSPDSRGFIEAIYNSVEGKPGGKPLVKGGPKPIPQPQGHLPPTPKPDPASGSLRMAAQPVAGSDIDSVYLKDPECTYYEFP